MFLTIRTLRLGYTLVAALAILSFCACKKSTQIGNKFVSNQSWLNGIFTDTFKLHTHIVRVDSVQTSSLNYYALGSVVDPAIGKTTAGLYTQVILPSASLTLGSIDSLRFDSLVLQIAYNDNTYPGWGWGTLKKPQTIKVYQVLDAMNNGTIYYSGDKFKVNPLPLGAKTFIPDFTDSVKVIRTKQQPHIRVRLDNTFGQTLLQKSSDGTFTSQADFLNFIQGLYITPDTSAGYSDGLMNISSDIPLSSMVLYYRFVHTSGKVDTLNAIYSLNSSGAKCNHFTHNYVNTINTLLTNPKTDSVIYVQGLSGLNTAVSLPALSYFTNKIINKAEVVITQVYDPTADSTFYTPSELYMVRYDSLKNKISVPDYNETYLYYGGVRNYVYDAQGHKLSQYKISIAGYLQDLILNKNNNKFGLYITNELNGIDLSRLIANGTTKQPNFRIKFNLIYTPIK